MSTADRPSGAGARRGVENDRRGDAWGARLAVARDQNAGEPGAGAAAAPPIGRWGAVALAALGGVCLAAAFPGRGWWPLALVAPALLVLALDGRRFWAGTGLGLVAGLAFYGPLVSWSSRFLGWLPWAALAVVLALSFALGAGLIAVATRWVPRRWPGWGGRLVALPIAVAGLWSLREQFASSWPYGGFAWGRIAQSQSNGPLLELVAWLGLTAMGAVMVWWSVLALELVRARPGVVPAVGHAALLAALMAVPALPLPTHGTVRLAAVQGDTPEAGYFSHGARGDVLAAHLAATRELVPEHAGVEAIIWPEGSVDIGPQYDAASARALSSLSADYGDIPVIANTVTVEGTRDDARYYNTQFVFTADRGWVEQQSKKRPVPFGEYIPDRDFWYQLAPDLIGLVARGYSPGADDAILHADGAALGTIICFDVIEDGVIRQSVADGAEVLILPTNNADFDRTDEAAQQIAFARMRSVETGMTVIQVSTVAYSAAFDGAGRELASVPWFEPGAMIVDAPRASGMTPAVVAGQGLGWACALAGLVPLLAAGDWVRRPEARMREGRTIRGSSGPRAGD